MNERQKLRYSRHILLKDMGEAGQEKISQSCALVIGAGGLGSAALIYLASSGVGKIIIVDDDAVEIHNLQRQVIHSTGRIGLSKAESARQTIYGINPTIDVKTVTKRMTEDALPELVRNADVVLDCTDNFAIRTAINRV
ncbi:MAG: HesA/MoeB/ThiF family protein, partial [Oxalobacter sp.]|nr:HesA/MoeB/ThiF family protein [Oxalobacter sp.]